MAAIRAAICASVPTNINVRHDVAMTGEITLRGRVLPIGGLKEKAVAAHRNKVREVIIPHGNLRDLDELPEEVLRTVRFHPVKTMDEVLAIALRGGAGVATIPPALDQPNAFAKPPAGYEQPTAH